MEHQCEYCDKEGVHAMSNGEYHYCDEHYKVIGVCDFCGIEIHEDWDSGATECGCLVCRPCAKQGCDCGTCAAESESESDEE